MNAEGTTRQQRSARPETRVTTAQEVIAREPAGPAYLVVIWGVHLGRKYELVDDRVLLGRALECDIVLEPDSVSRKHALLQREGDDWYATDLGSTNGTYVDNTMIRGRVRLDSGSLVRVGDTIFKFLDGRDIEAAYFEEIHRISVQDGLTQIANKRSFNEFLERELARCRRHGRVMALVMMDIDDFKSVNDTFGHLAGDLVLKELAAAISTRIRRTDLFARYGGEEFTLVLPETDLEGAARLAEDLRALVQDMVVDVDGNQIRITMSMGVAELDPKRHDNPQDLLKEADRKLYEAKNSGKNKVKS